MKLHISKINYKYTLKHSVSILIIATFLTAQVCPIAHAQNVSNLPLPGVMVTMSPGFTPTIVRGITVHPDNPLRFDFIVDTGDEHLEGEEFKKEAEKLIKYFLASLTIPEEELWVNLSPYEKNRIITKDFGLTDMGIDLLGQDYILKQLTASLIYPEDDLGNKFWQNVYKKAEQKYGTKEIPVNTFNKVWIVPDKAVVYEYNGSAFIVERHLKVMLEQDYLALKKNMENDEIGTDQLNENDVEQLSEVSSEVIREIVLPEIEKEVNEGKNFARLRQIYNSMILAAWYKGSLKESLLTQVYVDKNKVKGVDIDDKEVKNDIYNQYLEAFKKGVFDYIREDYDETKQEIIPRKYFSGGFTTDDGDDVPLVDEIQQDKITGPPSSQPKAVLDAAQIPKGEDRQVTFDLFDIGSQGDQTSAQGYSKGSPAQFLNTVRNDDDLLQAFLSEEGFRTKDIVEKRTNQDGTPYHPKTVQKEVKVLRDLEILVQVEGRRGYYRFSDDIQSLVGEDSGEGKRSIQILIDQINSIHHLVGEKGDPRALNRFDIPASKVGEVKEIVSGFIETNKGVVQAQLEKKEPRIVAVAGTFDDKGGTPSSIIAQMHAALPKGTTLFNGGNFAEIHQLIESLAPYDVVLWFPNIPNDKEKIRNVKERYPRKHVITSKRNHNNQYTLRDVADHALKLKSNLVVEFSDTVPFNMRLVDPLANTFEDTKAPETLAKAIVQRLEIVTSAKRQGTKLERGESPSATPDNPEFFRIIREKAGTFHDLMQTRPETAATEGTDEKYFRCERGFPSVREGSFVFVSKRDFAPNERFVSEDDVVPVDFQHFQETGQISYYGSNKPAVDTPIQVRLYEQFPRVNYILHSHEYVEGAPFTEVVHGSEALQEVDEILKVLGDNPETKNVAVNLRGHGSIVLAADLDYLDNVPYTTRTLLEERTKINAIIVGGSFDSQNGKPSSLISDLHASFPKGVEVRNGGSLDELSEIMDSLAGYEVVMWFPRIPEGEDAIVREIKQRYPFKTLIASMFNPKGDRPFQDMINSALGIRSNLFVEFTGDDNVQLKLYDPLSNQFTDTRSPGELAKAIMKRLETLRKFTRQGTMSVGDNLDIPESAELDSYLDLIRNYGERFHSLIHPAEGVERFLGNTAFRASHLFPDNQELEEVMFISQRNVDKRNLKRTGFVGVGMDSYSSSRISYYGDRKPSVDTPTQVRFLDALPNVNYILHSHVYVEDAPFTHELIPCGSCEEVEEVLTAIGHDYSKTNFAVNLLGHGSIIFARDLEFLQKNIAYASRPTPEPLRVDGRPADLIQRLRNTLDRIPPKEIQTDKEVVESGVVLVLRKINGRWHFLLTKRAQDVSYGGQWVLPGGRKDLNDVSVRNTALRELFEETGLTLQESNIIGDLQYEDTSDGEIRIFPFVVVAEESAELHPNRDEVVDEEWIPLDLAGTENITIQRESQEVSIEIGEANVRILRQFAEALNETGDQAMMAETALAKSKYVDQVKQIGAGREFVSVLITPNMKEIEAYAQQHDVYYVRDVDLVNHPVIQNLLWQIVEQINQGLVEDQKVRRIGILRTPLTNGSEGHEGIVEELYREENSEANVVVETPSMQLRQERIEEAKSQTNFEVEESEYFESDEFGREISDHHLGDRPLTNSLLKLFKQDFKFGRSEHYSRLLGLKSDNGEVLYRTMEDFFVGNDNIRFYRVMYNGRLAGRIVVDEETGTLVDALIFSPFRGNYLGDVVIDHLKKRFGQFNCIIPSGVPIYNFLKSRGVNVLHSESIGGIDYDIMSSGNIDGDQLKSVRELQASIRNIYAKALLNNFSEDEQEPEESALYKNFPEVYDLLYQRFSKRLSDFLGIVQRNTPNRGSILDAAAGTGEVSIPLIQEGYEVLSADLNPGMLEQLEKKAQSQGVKANTTVTSFQELSRREDQFDTLTVRQAINYLIGEEHLGEAFKGFHKLLRSGGKLVFNAPNYNPNRFTSPQRGPDWIKRGTTNAIVWETNSIDESHVLTHHQQAIIWDDNNRGDVRYYHDVNTFEMYTKDQFERVLNEAGFAEVEFLSSSGKPYDPEDPVIYVIASAGDKVQTSELPASSSTSAKANESIASEEGANQQEDTEEELSGDELRRRLADRYGIADVRILDFMNDGELERIYDLENEHGFESQLLKNLSTDSVILRGDRLDNIASVLRGRGFLATAEDPFRSHLTTDPKVADSFGKAEGQFVLEFDTRRLGQMQGNMYAGSSRMYHAKDSVMGPPADLRALTDQSKEDLLIQLVEQGFIKPEEEAEARRFLFDSLEENVPSRAWNSFIRLADHLTEDDIFELWSTYHSAGVGEIVKRLSELAEKYSLENVNLNGLEGTPIVQKLPTLFYRYAEVFEERVEREKTELSERIYDLSEEVFFLFSALGFAREGRQPIIMSMDKFDDSSTDINAAVLEARRRGENYFRTSKSEFHASLKSGLNFGSVGKLRETEGVDGLRYLRNLTEKLEEARARLAAEAEGFGVEGSDSDSLAKPAQSDQTDQPLGGIDLNLSLLDLQIKRDGNGVPLPTKQQPIHNMKIEGFFPVIINVSPVNIPLLLGETDEIELNNQQLSLAQ